MTLKTGGPKVYCLGPKTKRLSPLFRIHGLYGEYVNSFEMCDKIIKLLPIFSLGASSIESWIWIISHSVDHTDSWPQHKINEWRDAICTCVNSLNLINLEYKISTLFQATQVILSVPPGPQGTSAPVSLLSRHTVPPPPKSPVEPPLLWPPSLLPQELSSPLPLHFSHWTSISHNALHSTKRRWGRLCAKGFTHSSGIGNENSLAN